MAIGIYLVGTTGHVRGSLGATLLGAITGQIIRLSRNWEMHRVSLGEEGSLGGMNMICALIAFYYSSTYDPSALNPSLRIRAQREGVYTRCIWVFGLAAAFWCVAGLGAYEHGSITIDDAQTGPGNIAFKTINYAFKMINLYVKMTDFGAGLPTVVKIKELVQNILTSPAIQQVDISKR